MTASRPARFASSAIICITLLCLAGVCVPRTAAYANSSSLAPALSTQSQSGIGSCEWDEYQWVDGVTTSKKIVLEGEYYPIGKEKPDGYILYRKGPKQKGFSKITVVKKKGATFKYTDKKVTFGKDYKYKFQAYRMVNGQVVCGKMSKTVTMTAVNRTAECTVKTLTVPGTTTTCIDLKVTSGKGNGTIRFGDSAYYTEFAYNPETGVEEGTDTDVRLELVRVSKNGKTWKTAPNKTTLKAKKTIYLRFAVDDPSGAFVFDPLKMSGSLDVGGMRYNGFQAVLDMSFSNTKATVQIDDECYH